MGISIGARALFFQARRLFWPHEIFGVGIGHGYFLRLWNIENAYEPRHREGVATLP